MDARHAGRWLRSALFVGAFCVASKAYADDARPNDEEPRAATGQAPSAKHHFDEALNHYREGHYRAAVAELKAALTFDPTSKDLVYNLALVHEKLGELDLAIAALERYAELETDPKELARARQARERMQGARSELSVPVVVPARVPIPPLTMPINERRTNPLVIATGVMAAAAGTLGIVFGIRALVLAPGSSASTGPGTSIDDLREQQGRAETSARVADVSFAVGALSGIACAVLWVHDQPRALPTSTSFAPPLGFRWGTTF